MSHLLTIELGDTQMERLSQLARLRGLTPAETSAQLVGEALRLTDFPLVEFRDSPVGRQPYVKGSTLAVWEVVYIARSLDMDAPQTAMHLEWPIEKVQAALDYSQAYPDEVEVAIAENDACDFESLRSIVPHAELFLVSEAGEVRRASEGQ